MKDRKIKYVRKEVAPKPKYVNQFGQASTSLDVLRTLSYSLSIDGVTPKQFLQNFDQNEKNVDVAAKAIGACEIIERAVEAAENADKKLLHEILAELTAKMESMSFST